MTTYTTSRPGQATRPDVEAYVRRCVTYFDDLPSDVRASLEHDVREIVSEVTAELDGDPADLVGPPNRFAADLRAAAGLPSRSDPEVELAAPASRSPFAVLLGWVGTVAWPWLKELACDLLPAMWVARGLVIPVLLFPEIPSFVAFLVWVALTVALVVGSVSLGRRSSKPRRFKRAGLGLIAAALLTVAFANSDSGEAVYVEAAPYSGPSDIQAAPLPEHVTHSNTSGAMFAVYDVHTDEPLFMSSELVGDELVEVLSLTPFDAPNGFRVESHSNGGIVESRVPTWDGVIALATASFQ